MRTVGIQFSVGGDIGVTMRKFSKLLLTLVLAAAFASGPFELGFGATGLPKLKLSAAQAKSGSGSDGDGGDDSDDDDDNDDNSGRGNSRDRGEDDDRGSSDARAGRSGSKDGGSDYRPGRAIAQIELSRAGVKILYADGGREEIESGVYELRDPAGRRVTKRRATGADIARLKAVSTRVSIQSVIRRETRQSDIGSVAAQGTSISVTYANGWLEGIDGGVYELTDPFGRTVARRPATEQDRKRLSELRRGN